MDNTNNERQANLLRCRGFARLVLSLTVFIMGLHSNIACSQEWVKSDAGRSEYIQERTACAQQAQSMALTGEDLQKDIMECLTGKGWKRNQDNTKLELYCETRPIGQVCRSGGTADEYAKVKAECMEYVAKTAGNTYSKPGGWGLIGILAASAEAAENKKKLERAQRAAGVICMEGKGWKINYVDGSKEDYIQGN